MLHTLFFCITSLPQALLHLHPNDPIIVATWCHAVTMSAPHLSWPRPRILVTQADSGVESGNLCSEYNSAPIIWFDNFILIILHPLRHHQTRTATSHRAVMRPRTTSTESRTIFTFQYRHIGNFLVADSVNLKVIMINGPQIFFEIAKLFFVRLLSSSR